MNGIQRKESDMLNQFVVVGKVKEISNVKETGTGFKYATLLVEVTRSFKNADNIYEVDPMVFMLWRGIAENCATSCESGDLVGIKGRIQSKEHISNEGHTFHNYELIAEKVSFLKKEEK